MRSYEHRIDVYAFLCFTLAVVVLPVTDAHETACVLDDIPLVQVEHSLRTAFTADDGEKKHGEMNIAKNTVWKSMRLKERTGVKSKKHMANHTSPLIYLDHCSDNEMFVSLVAVVVSGSVFLASSIVVLLVLGVGSEDDARKKFHATRIMPWMYLFLIGTCSIPLTLSRMWSENTRWSQIVTSCVPIVPTFVVTQFALLLVYDLVWICGVFGSWRKKPLLLAHHGGYITWCVLTLYAKVGYINLVTIIIGFEELPELVASVSYLKKDGEPANFWLVFTIVFRMCCSAYAIGCTILFIILGDAHVALKGFLWFDICLWFAFMGQEWYALRELTSKQIAHHAKTANRQDGAAPEDTSATTTPLESS